MLTAAIAFTTDMDGGLSTLGAAAGLTLAAGVSNVDTQMGKISKALGSMAAGIAALKGHQGTLYALSANAEAASFLPVKKSDMPLPRAVCITPILLPAG